MAEHTVTIFLVRQILHGAERRGHDVAAILRRAGIDPCVLDDPRSRVSSAQYAALMRTLRRVMRDEFWGQGERPMLPGTFAALCAALVHCADLGAALNTGFSIMRRVLGDPSARLRIEGGLAVVRVRHRREVSGYDFSAATFMYETMQLAGWLVGREIPLQRVDFRFAAPPHHVDSLRLLLGRRRHRAGENLLAFDADLLALPVVQDRDTLAAFLARTPDNLVLRFRRDGSLVQQVRHFLKPHLAGSPPPLPACAAALGLSAPTLRRRLRAEGQGYQRILDELRRDAAVALLRQPDLPLDRIAASVGFSESSTFHRAFKRWTGAAPGAWRRAAVELRESAKN